VRIPDAENVLREEASLAFPDVLVYAGMPDVRMGEGPSIVFTQTGGTIQYPARAETLVAVDSRAKLLSVARETLADLTAWLYDRLEAGTLGELILHQIETTGVMYENPDLDRPDLQRVTTNIRIVYRLTN